MKADTEILVAKSSRRVRVGGRSVTVRVGDTVLASDPVVKGREGLFGPWAPSLDTTAVLGTRATRGTRRRSSSS